MSKRYIPLPIQTVSAKRQKTEVEHRENGYTVKTSAKFQYKASASIPIKKVPSISAISDDDDDDLLFIVSSQLEQKAKAPPVPPDNAYSNMSESFNSVFSAGASMKTSTQRFATRPRDHEPKDYLDDDGDLLLSQFNYDENMVQLQKQKEQNLMKPGTSKDTDVFKVPGRSAGHQQLNDLMEQSVILPSQMTVSDEARSNLQQRRQKASELKIKYLQDLVEKLKESKKKSEEKERASEQRIKTQMDEITSLKYEIKKLKQMLEDLRQDKLKDSEKINKEWSERMLELENKLKLRQIELDQKKIEIMNVVMKRSVPSTSNQKRQVSEPKIDVSDIYAMCQQLYTIPRLPIKMNSLIFEEIDEKHIKNREICVKQYDLLIMGLSKLFITDYPSPILISQIMPTIKTVLRHIIRHALKLRRINPEEFKFVPLAEVKLLAGTILKNKPLELCELHPMGQPTIFDASENIRDEKILVARRCLAVISEMCRSQAFVTFFIDEQTGFLKNLKLIVQIIGASDEHPEYSVLISAIMTIVYNIYINTRSNKSSDILIFQLFKSVVHCRVLNYVTLLKISHMLQKSASYQDKQFLMYFCTKNTDIIQKSDLVAGIIRFSSSSCVLQVFGACLETSVRYNGPLDASKIQILADIVINIQHFLTTVEDLQIPWIYQPPVGDQTPIYPCIPKLICGFIQILTTCLRAFQNNLSVIDEKTMCYVAKSAAIVLGRTFEQYEQYQIDMFTYGCGSLLTVKSSFKTAVSILSKFSKQFEFEPIHQRAMEILKSPKILMDYEEEIDRSQEKTGDYEFDSLDDYKKNY